MADDSKEILSLLWGRIWLKTSAWSITAHFSSMPLGQVCRKLGGFCGIRATLLALSLQLTTEFNVLEVKLGPWCDQWESVFGWSGQSLKVVCKIVSWDMK